MAPLALSFRIAPDPFCLLFTIDSNDHLAEEPRIACHPKNIYSLCPVSILLLRLISYQFHSIPRVYVNTDLYGSIHFFEQSHGQQNSNIDSIGRDNSLTLVHLPEWARSRSSTEALKKPRKPIN